MLALRKWLITLLTIGTGGAGGLAAPMVAIGEAVGAGWARLVGTRSASALRTCQLAAIGAAVATLFGAPPREWVLIAVPTPRDGRRIFNGTDVHDDNQRRNAIVAIAGLYHRLSVHLIRQQGRLH